MQIQHGYFGGNAHAQGKAKPLRCSASHPEERRVPFEETVQIAPAYKPQEKAVPDKLAAVRMPADLKDDATGRVSAPACRTVGHEKNRADSPIPGKTGQGFFYVRPGPRARAFLSVTPASTNVPSEVLSLAWLFASTCTESGSAAMMPA